MCGLFGFSDPKGNIHPEIRQKVAALNALRGEEGVGFAFLHPKKGVKMWKNQMSIVDLLANSSQGPKHSWDSPMLLGHCRRASRGNFIGGRSDENAHPFQFGHIIGAHNGFMTNWMEEGRKIFQSMIKVDVDSQVIMRLLMEHGPEGLKNVQGAATVWWVDLEDKPGKFYVWQWKQDLAYMQGDDWFAFSSEKRHLLAAGFRGKVFEPAKDLGLLFSVEDGIMTPLEPQEGKSWVDKETPKVTRSWPPSRSNGAWGYGVIDGDYEERRAVAEAIIQKTMVNQDMVDFLQACDSRDYCDLLIALANRTVSHYCPECKSLTGYEFLNKMWDPGAHDHVFRHKKCSTLVMDIPYHIRKKMCAIIYIHMRDEMKPIMDKELENAMSVNTEALKEEVKKVMKAMDDVKATAKDDPATDGEAPDSAEFDRATESTP